MVKDWLVDDPTVRAKELQRRIKDTFKILVPYIAVGGGLEGRSNFFPIHIH
jgi:hypothetical protein